MNIDNHSNNDKPLP